MSEKLKIIAPDRQQHGEELVDLVCKTFGRYSEHLLFAREFMLNDPMYSFPASRIGILDGRIVTHFGVYDYQMCVGIARLRTAGIGSVGTHYDYRKRGLMEQTARDCIDGMREAGFDFSILFGIPDFYHRFGYSRAWSEREIGLSLVDLPEPATGLTEFVLERRPDLERLFNRYHADITGTAVRPTHDKWNPRQKQIAFSWKDGRGKVAGYVVVEDKGPRIDVIEAVGDSQKILAALSFAARKFVCDEIRFVYLPHHTPLAKTLRRGNAQEKIVHFKNANALARVIHLPRALSKMTGEFSRRLSDAGLHDYHGKLALTDGQDSVTLHIAGREVKTTVKREQTPHTLRADNMISQFVLGTDSPDEILEAGDMKVTGDARFLIPALFPNQHPMLHAQDRY
jgi:predicted acetyltransferase